MKSYSLCFLLAFLFVQTSSGQIVKLVGLKSDTIKGNNKFSASDNGGRTIELKFAIDKSFLKRSRDCDVNLGLDASTAPLSAPELIDKEIIIKALAIRNYNNDTIIYKVKLKLAAVSCMENDEQFKISVSGDGGKVGGPPQTVIIKHFTTVPPNFETVLGIDSTIVEPHLSSNSNDNGLRTVLLNVYYSGKNPPAADQTIDFNIPPFIRSESKPAIQNNVALTVSHSLFNANGCPVRVQIPVVVKLDAVDSFKAEEKIPIVIKGNDKQAHLLIIRSSKPISTVSPPAPPAVSGFNISCSKENNFVVSIKKDSPFIAIVVRYLKKDTTATYKYASKFNGFDFARWLTGTFKLVNINDKCDDCSLCAAYVAEKINDELMASKIGQESTKSVAATDTAKKTTDTSAAKKDVSTAKATVPDTIVHKSSISYSDTLLFSLNIQRTATKTQLKLCRDPQKGKDSCQGITVGGDLTKAQFDQYINLFLAKFVGGEANVDPKNIKPSTAEEYDKYQKTIEQQTPKEKSEAQKALEALGADEYAETKVGVIYLKDSTIDIYDDAARFLKKTKIDSVEIVIEAGKMMRRLLTVSTKHGVFTNKQAPIPVGRINDRGLDMLSNTTSGEHNFVYLKDVLRYKSLAGYYPDDNDSISLVPGIKRSQKTLTAAANLNSLINLTIYTDFAGLLGRRANGLINSDVTGKFITNTRNITNWDATWLSFIESNIVLSKFDSKFKSLDSSSIKNISPGKDSIDRMRMMEIAWLKGSMKFNLLSFKISRSQYFNINAAARINVVNADTFYRKQTDILYFDYWPEANYSINRLKNFGMDITVRWLFQRVADREKFSNKGLEQVFNPRIAFFYYPTRKANNKIYLQFNYFANHNDDAMNFYQLQFGWQSSLNLSK